MGQVKFVEKSLSTIWSDMVCLLNGLSISEYFDPFLGFFNQQKTVNHVLNKLEERLW